MTVSPLADMSLDMPAGDKWNYRQDEVSQVILHHNAGIDAYKYVVESGREVSAHYWVGNHGEIAPQVDEDYRAWTSAMLGYPAGLAADHRSITFEISNSGGAPDWPISPAALESAARLIGDIFQRYNLGPVTRQRVAVHRDYVPTECPGPYVMAHLSEIITKAEAYRVGSVEEDPLGGIMGYYENKQSFRADLRDIIRRHVPLAEMKSAHKDSRGRYVASNLATEIRRNTRVGYQVRTKQVRTEAKVDKLQERVHQLEKLISTLGSAQGIAAARLKVDEAAVDQAEQDSLKRQTEELTAEDQETEQYLSESSQEDDAEAEEEDSA